MHDARECVLGQGRARVLDVQRSEKRNVLCKVTRSAHRNPPEPHPNVACSCICLYVILVSVAFGFPAEAMRHAAPSGEVSPLLCGVIDCRRTDGVAKRHAMMWLISKIMKTPATTSRVQIPSETCGPGFEDRKPRKNTPKETGRIKGRQTELRFPSCFYRSSLESKMESLTNDLT